MKEGLVQEKESLNHDLKTYARKQTDVVECFLCHDADVPTRDSVDPDPFFITRRDE
jgi:hypothetical protein